MGSSINKKELVKKIEQLTEAEAIVTENEMIVSIGPQHSGAGHFRIILKLDGDIIVDAIPDPGFVHRSYEKLAENMTYIHNVPLAEKPNHADPANLVMGYVRTVEELSGIEVPERAQYIRTIVCEINRIMSHLYFFGIFGIFLNHSTMFMWATGDRDLFADLNQMLTGARITQAFFLAGGVYRDVPQGFKEKALKTLDYFERHLDDYEKIFMENPILQERTVGIGVLRPEDAIKLGVVGPVLRGSGIKHDVRKDDPYAAYDKIDFEIPSFKEGDSYSRVMVRFREMQESIKIIRQALKDLPPGPIRNPEGRLVPRWPVKSGEYYSRAEAARGEVGFYLVSDGTEKPYRLKMASPSFRNLPAIPFLLRGATLADLPAIYMSIDYWGPEADR
jgi:NADH-quinone oxidoreductase subunit D